MGLRRKRLFLMCFVVFASSSLLFKFDDYIDQLHRIICRHNETQIVVMRMQWVCVCDMSCLILGVYCNFLLFALGMFAFHLILTEAYVIVMVFGQGDLSKPETIPATLVGIHTIIDCATGRPEEPIKTVLFLGFFHLQIDEASAVCCLVAYSG